MPQVTDSYKPGIEAFEKIIRSIDGSLGTKLTETDIAKALVSFASIEQMVSAITAHAEALTESAKASDRYSARLVAATWGLVAATAALFLTAIAQVAVTIWR